ncbi:hypothetical protein C0Q70_10159 [Pomacea canaliculata]|uniref:Uncharacterized protein n=1 Tax=Pomacea canaliculata TaxID=400727 RepID=A0A2T7PBT9_POMCA|nr:hypothetical protein C0Q70_10159 [Pomacea canaliculata]
MNARARTVHAFTLVIKPRTCAPKSRPGRDGWNRFTTQKVPFENAGSSVGLSPPLVFALPSLLTDP